MALGSKQTKPPTPHTIKQVGITVHVPQPQYMYRHTTKASQTAELKLTKFQTSSSPPQVTNPRITNHL